MQKKFWNFCGGDTRLGSKIYPASSQGAFFSAIIIFFSLKRLWRQECGQATKATGHVGKTIHI